MIFRLRFNWANVRILGLILDLVGVYISLIESRLKWTNVLARLTTGSFTNTSAYTNSPKSFISYAGRARSYTHSCTLNRTWTPRAHIYICTFYFYFYFHSCSASFFSLCFEWWAVLLHFMLQTWYIELQECVLCSLATCPFSSYNSVLRLWFSSMNDFLFVAIYFRKHTPYKMNWCMRFAHAAADYSEYTPEKAKKWVKRVKCRQVSQSFGMTSPRMYLYRWNPYSSSPIRPNE